MKLQIKNKSRLVTLAAGAVFMVGILLCYYAFEKVSIPHVRDSHEMRTLLMGTVLMIAGALFLGYRWRQMKNRPDEESLK